MNQYSKTNDQIQAVIDDNEMFEANEWKNKEGKNSSFNAEEMHWKIAPKLHNLIIHYTFFFCCAFRFADLYCLYSNVMNDGVCRVQLSV